MISFKSALKELHRGNAWPAYLGAFLVSIHLAAPAYSIVLEKKDPQGASQKGDSTVAEYISGEVLVKFKAGVTAAEKKIFHKEAETEVIAEIREIGVQKVKSKKGESTEALIEKYGKNPHVAYAEPNGFFYIHLTPNDPRFTELWGLHNIGQTITKPVGAPADNFAISFSGTSDADIDALEAWNRQTGSPGIIVADIDTGMDYNHEDLAANIWTNPGELAGNGIDDDGNGYIDDVHGWDFANNDNDPMDDNMHGTHTSGTIAAVGNNGIGVVGVAWQAKIMAVKFITEYGGGTWENAAKAILYASQMGAKISNNSWGCTGDRRSCYSRTLEDAIKAANQRGMLFVVSAGNANNDNDGSTISYPCSASSPNVLCVAATDYNDQKADFSSYGKYTVDLGAPGVDVLSTIPNSIEPWRGGYRFASGTSMASPHVSGAAALALSRFPSLTVDQLKGLLMNSVDKIPAMDGITVTGGRLNVNNVLGTNFNVIAAPYNQRITIGSSTAYTITVASANNFSAPVALTLASPDTGITGSFSATPVTPPLNGTVSSTLMLSTASATPIGNYVLTINGQDSAGEVRSANVVLEVVPDTDLTVTQVNGPSNAVTGGSITITNTVLNQGTAAAGEFSMNIYLSPDTLISKEDILIGQRVVNGLSAGYSDTEETALTLPASLSPGTYYLGAVADLKNVAPETTEDNNTLVGNMLAISIGPDLIVTAINGPASAAAGGSFTISDTIANQGTGSVTQAPYYVGFYLSQDATITTSDIIIGRRTLGGLLSGESGTGTTTVTAPSDIQRGTYYFGAVVDYDGQITESNESNNILPGSMITISTAIIVQQPDLMVTTDFGGTYGYYEAATAVAVQSDGKSVVGGNTSETPYATTTVAALARYNPEGSLDTAFGTGGKVITDLGGYSTKLSAVAIQPDGKIVTAGGYVELPGGVPDFAVVRYNADGSLDSTFGAGGKVLTDFRDYFGYGDEATAVAIQPDGKIVAGGYSATALGRAFALARYNPDGSPDASFGAGGKVATVINCEENRIAMTIQTDGKIVMAGSALRSVAGSFFPDSDVALARYNPDGSPDASFGAGGTVITDFGLADQAYAVVIQSDGKLVIGGNMVTSDTSFYDFLLARYNPDGTLDSSFGNKGMVTTDINKNEDRANALIIQLDGKLVAGGYGISGCYSLIGCISDFALIRYNTDGGLDTTFGRRGVLTTDWGGYKDGINGLAIQSDGKIWAAGGTDNDFALSRYLPW
ncbi:MAG: S8 family serine peptidase [Nitrospirota bacterium]